MRLGEGGQTMKLRATTIAVVISGKKDCLSSKQGARQAGSRLGKLTWLHVAEKKINRKNLNFVSNGLSISKSLP